MALDLSGVPLPAAPRVSSGDGGLAAAVYAGVVAIAWSVTLWRLRGLTVRNFSTLAMTGFLLLIGGVLSLITPVSVVGSGDWAPLVAVVLFPVLVVSVLLIVLAVVPSLRWLNGERRASPAFSASAAGLPTGRSRR
jgi:hypothetical protein